MFCFLNAHERRSCLLAMSWSIGWRTHWVVRYRLTLLQVHWECPLKIKHIQIKKNTNCSLLLQTSLVYVYVFFVFSSLAFMLFATYSRRVQELICTCSRRHWHVAHVLFESTHPDRLALVRALVSIVRLPYVVQHRLSIRYLSEYVAVAFLDLVSGA